MEKGYDNVTLDDMAAAGGVSRSTLLRYSRTKDQAILVALKAYIERIADALRARSPTLARAAPRLRRAAGQRTAASRR